MGFEIVPCAAWTTEITGTRRAQLEEWKTTRPGDTAAMDEGFAWIEETAQEDGLAGDPRGIHTDRYDEIVIAGMSGSSMRAPWWRRP